MGENVSQEIVVDITESFFPNRGLRYGTDKELLGPDLPLRTPTKGRPRVNRNLAKRLIEAKYRTSQIARALKCDEKTVRRIRKELLENGELIIEKENGNLDIVELDFDEECIRATGMSFHAWLKTKTVRANYIFNWCRKVWQNIWDRPSLVLAKDSNFKLGDTLCIKFLEYFGDDKKRIRGRKKHIRNLFRFMGRTDLNDRHLTTRKDKDPISVKRVPEISMLGFPSKLQKCIDWMNDNHGENIDLALRLKLSTLMRTGEPKDERGLLGLKKGSDSKSYLIMNDADNYRCSVLEKKNEDWDINWIPREVREQLYEKYVDTESGEFIFDSKEIKGLISVWKEITKKVIGVELDLHDLRKVSITWLWVMKIPLEIAVDINVGWRDMNTAKNHYLHARKLLKNDERAKYREQIPDWFKDGLEQFKEEI